MDEVKVSEEALEMLRSAQERLAAAQAIRDHVFAEVARRYRIGEGCSVNLLTGVITGAPAAVETPQEINS